MSPQSLKSIATTAIIITLTGCSLLSSPATYSVKKVSDGDTITVTDASGTDIKVRFACVDAPEVPHTAKERKSRKLVDKSQFQWGGKAQQRVQQLVAQGGDRVQLTVTDTDQYGRKISEVHLADGTLIQEVLIQEGLAQVYRPYLKNCPSAAIVEQAEADAKKKRRGVWQDPKYVSAWEWRRSSK
ncbi:MULTISPECIES: thermonuclease family protein [unclassified Coleofasciculus]|uniref:thermonuclease family protein n=1 Tax=unclassified Coleofasciculus TaxID=2692782 RepID=UPI001882C8DC|nr:MULTISPECIES: thermonuclease family protein [unclassified Coleofasciculus]MBE9127007.1 thermonuclease family protein [Coleofasciculus sp. LEGE 07081]MBE9149114.1 thermonuclease family protein [Coleofasciculus sp. LEGE 07092]